MKSPFEEVDKLGRDALRNHEIKPPPYIYQKIKKRMFWYNIRLALKSNLILTSAFMAAGISVITLSIIIAGYDTNDEALFSKELASSGIARNNQSENNPTDIKYNAAKVILKKSDKPSSEKNKNSITATAQIPNAESSQPASNPENEAVIIERDKSNEGSHTPAERTKVPCLSQTIIPDEIQMKEHNVIPSDSYYSRHLHFRKQRFSLYAGTSVFMPSFSGADITIDGAISGNLQAGIACKLTHNIYLETGIGYTMFRGSSSPGNFLFNPQSFTEMQLTGYYLNIDTNAYWHYRIIQDSVIHILDSSWVSTYDSTTINQYTAISQIKYDTAAASSYSMDLSIVEVPLIAACRFGYGATRWVVKGGMILGMLTRTESALPLPGSMQGELPLTTMYVTRELQTSWIVSAGISRRISERWTLECTPFYRKNIKGLKGRESRPDLKYSAWGIGFGIYFDL